MLVVPTGIDPTPSICRASGVLLFYGNSVLLCKRCVTFHGLPVTFPGYWSPFTGALEEGENPIVAAIRELEEESGLQLKMHDLRYLTQLEDESRVLTLYAHELRELFHPRLDAEHTEYGYFKLESLHMSPSPLCPLIRKVVQEYDEGRRRA